MIPVYRLLALRVRKELDELERSVGRTQRAWQAARHVQSDQDMYVDSAALNLHGFYSGLERQFEYIAYQLDGGPPKGDAWHRDLLRQMTIEVPGIRPAVIAVETARQLDEFRRFRHVVRNVYAEYLEPGRIGDLAGKLPAVWNQLRSELEAFATFLEGVSSADDEVPE
ncbi:MAG TPA: antitoxin [Anaerolineae bacterium]|nr:antitoxin [Anaerolineae bacterium]